MNLWRTNTRMIRHAFVALATAGSMMCAHQARADSVLIGANTGASTEGLGSFTGSLEYLADPFDDEGLLIVTLTNTGSVGNGGYITGFLFNFDSSDDDAEVELEDVTHPFTQTFGNGLNGNPFGNPYDAGAALGGNFSGGGNPTPGIAVGDTGMFEFEIEADDADILTALSFMTGPFDHNFVVRFRGFEDGGSDKVPANIVPLPAPVAMGALGLLGVMFGARRLRRSA